jgi:hypothetical protein
MERSVFSDRMVFVRAVKESGWMGDVELAVYDSWFGPILDSNPSLVPDGFIYLRCKPDTCMERCAACWQHAETFGWFLGCWSMFALQAPCRAPGQAESMHACMCDWTVVNAWAVLLV